MAFAAHPDTFPAARGFRHALPLENICTGLSHGLLRLEHKWAALS